MAEEVAVLRVPELASLGRRLVAQIGDGLITVGIFLLGVLFLDTVDGIAIAMFWLAVAYYLLADGLPGGQSLAKKVLGIAVVSSDTEAPCGYFSSFLRNATQVVGIFDWVWIFGSKRRRLGDMLAQTKVIKVG